MSKEIATKCLLEAIELLNEGGARQKYAKILEDKENKNDRKRAEIEKEFDKIRNKKKFVHSTPKHKQIKEKLDSRQAKLRKEYGELSEEFKDILDKESDYTFAAKKHGPLSPELVKHDKKCKKEFNKMVYKKNGPASELNRAISIRKGKSNNESIELAALLAEAAELLNDNNSNDPEVLDESVGELLGPILGLLAVYSILPVMAMVAARAQNKRIAKESKQITREELHDAVTFLNTLKDKIKILFKQSKYKKFIDEGIIDIRSEFIDASTSKNIKHKPFSVGYTLFVINLIKLSKLQKKYDEVITTPDRLSDYIKNETKEIAKVCDKVREIVYKNDFIKDNFNVMLLFNDNKSACYCNLELKQPLVLNTSKYLKTKGDK